MNQPPTHCPYCGAEVETLDAPMIHYCDSCDDYVFYNPTPGGSTAVVDGDRLLLVEDFRSSGEWKLPAGRVECGESAREGVARELEEETNLVVDPAHLVYFYDSAGEPVPGQHMVNIDFAVRRSETSGTVEAGSDATDAQFFSPAEFEASDYTIKAPHVDRFGTDDLEWLREEAALELHGR